MVPIHKRGNTTFILKRCFTKAGLISSKAGKWTPAFKQPKFKLNGLLP
jgi:hypothetical protein